MKLKKAILECEDEWIYVGARRGYVWIGKKEAFEQELEKASIEYYTKLMTISIPNVKGRIECVEGQLKKYKELAKTDLAYAGICREKELKLKQLRTRLDTLTRYSKKFTEFCDREVTETYKRDVFGPNGTVFIIPGIESGAWDFEEFQKGVNHCGERSNEEND